MQTKKRSNIFLQNQYDFVFVIPPLSPFLYFAAHMNHLSSLYL